MINDEQLKAMREDQPPWLKKQEGATGPQQKYMATLIESREVPEKWLLRIKELTESEALTKRKASDIITSLKGAAVQAEHGEHQGLRSLVQGHSGWLLRTPGHGASGGTERHRLLPRQEAEGLRR
jgi:hypothetical protein